METSALETRSGGDNAGQLSDPSGIVFDTSSGISLEEQQEILTGINAMAGGNRLAPAAAVTKPKKKGFLFPLLVNAGALVLLAAGFVLLSHFHGQDEQSIRESSAALGLTERKLIQEIRQETSRQLGEKENEINDILSKLSAADAEYKGLQASVSSLTEAQKERAASLLKTQDEYRRSLSDLQNEKAKILDDSRQREVNLRTQAEAKVAELSSQVEQGQANLGAAMEELRRLTAEQDKAAGVEAQMGGYYASLNEQIKSGRLDDASATLASMKALLNAPAFLGNRSFEVKKQMHLSAIAAVEGAIADARRYEAAASRETAASKEVTASREAAASPDSSSVQAAQNEALANLKSQITNLEQKIADQERAIAAYNSQGSEQGKLIAGFETTINDLRNANVNQQMTLNRRDSEIVSLRTDNAAKAEQLAELNQNLSALQTQVQAANTKTQQSDAALAAQRQANAALSQQITSLTQERDALQRELQTFRDAARQLLGQ
ncbi:MAG: hypothetical protein FWC45_07835 [Treponema sp.]|nr:hypothetical protein [Treponema sp.]